MLGIFNRNTQPKDAAKVEVNPYSYRNENGKKVNVPTHERTVYRSQSPDPTVALRQEIESLKDLVQGQQELIEEQRQMIELLRQGGSSNGGDWRTKAEWATVVIDHLVEMVDDSILYRLKGILRNRYNGSIRVAPVGFRMARSKPSG